MKLWNRQNHRSTSSEDMSVWRCMICIIFVAFRLKNLLSHINVTHGRNAEFWVFCGIDGCEQEFRVFNSFYRHLKRTHPLYVTSGCPPCQWRTTPTSAPPLLENFGVSIFGNSMTPSMDSSMESSPDLLELGTQDPPEMPEAQSSNAVSLQLSLVLLSRLCAGGM